ncbi:MAG: DUF362 domain-containing protein, partial [Rectinema sp.]|nr:DUF362 domain-containing protein [Rectinema sp.]
MHELPDSPYTAAMSSNTNHVALLRCREYDPSALDTVFEQAAEYAGFPDIRGARILLKPNILMASQAAKAVTTHPEFVAAAVRFARARGASEIWIGDSPGWQPAILAAKASGIYDAALGAGAAWADFRDASPIPVESGKKLLNIPLTTWLKKIDLVINLPKLKNHRLMTYTGAMKNLFGLIPGTAKSALHLQYPAVRDFGEMLVDLALSVRCFTFMDGIVAMQGEGPGSGTPYNLGIILASNSTADLDWTAVRCVGYNPHRIPYLVDAMERVYKVGQPGSAEEIPEPHTMPLRPSDIEHEGFELLPYQSELEQKLTGVPSKLRTRAAALIRL